MVEYTEAALEAVPWFTGLATAWMVWWGFRRPPVSQYARLQRFVAADWADSHRFPGGAEERWGKARLWV